ncbi:uncharacterized protein [Spinacia oleracea]|uniref:Uncharacterized protein isoform X1 n=2 Tax=Spinacia oleracea TaxID=3562 RepID=A0A9R0KBX2_SPIOL|nr:uncharacterized protein LOC110804678 isoform X1 [Spinacia oleracea]
MTLPHPLHSCEQGDGPPNHYHHDHSKDDESWLPDKSKLELVLDTLQRRDTYDIFAEPVDPSEVEEYYEIIKEPMDFGTMRAKLHEGMYKNLQQFEHDVYLIFGNAMHFNSSATVYFRQARALEDLAKKLFFVLKTDTENFKVDYTTIRRRSSRRFDGEHNGLTFGSYRKLQRHLESYGISTDLDRKGFGRQRRTCLTGVDRRSTYKPWIRLASSADSPIFCDSKSLIRTNQEEIRYKESLLLFVKDLGPTAHRVASNKLQGLWMQASSCSRRSSINDWDNSSTCNSLAPAASSSVQREPNNFLFSGTTCPASHNLIGIVTTNDKKKPSDVCKIGEKSARSCLDTKSTITCTNQPEVQGNMKSMAVFARRHKLHQNISLGQYGEDVDAIVHTGSKVNENTELTTPTVLQKDGDMLSYSVNTMPSAVKETKLKQIQAVNNFDLNQVQAIPSSSYLVRCSYKDDNLKTHRVIPSSALLGASEFNPAGQTTTAIHEVVNYMQPSSVSNQFLFNLKSRLIDLSDDDFDNSSTTIAAGYLRR